MRYVLALLAGAALAVSIYRRFSAQRDSPYAMAATGLAGAIAAFLLLWLIQNGIGKAFSILGTALVLLMVAVTVIPVVTISILSARKAHDVRISAKLRWERSHPRVTGLSRDRDD